MVGFFIHTPQENPPPLCLPDNTVLCHDLHKTGPAKRLIPMRGGRCTPICASPICIATPCTRNCKSRRPRRPRPRPPGCRWHAGCSASASGVCPGHVPLVRPGATHLVVGSRSTHGLARGELPTPSLASQDPAGNAHSVETWIDGKLAGGLYCVALGQAVFGESMFAHATDASKIALAALVALCRRQGGTMIDCQQNTRHLASLGAHEIARAQFLSHIQNALDRPALSWSFEPVYWNELLPSTAPTA